MPMRRPITVCPSVVFGRGHSAMLLMTAVVGMANELRCIRRSTGVEVLGSCHMFWLLSSSQRFVRRDKEFGRLWPSLSHSLQRQLGTVVRSATRICWSAQQTPDVPIRVPSSSEDHVHCTLFVVADDGANAAAL